jgi:hypothetical protein
MSAMIELKARFFVLPAIAVAVLAMLHPAASGRSVQGPCMVQTLDPGIRASFSRFADNQSQAAARICALAGNTIR